MILRVCKKGLGNNEVRETTSIEAKKDQAFVKGKRREGRILNRKVLEMFRGLKVRRITVLYVNTLDVSGYWREVVKCQIIQT